jgi:hypothetical protein
MGSRFKGEIKPGAMPWKNRYIGNPVLTGILNLLFNPGISDAHCGLRALTKACFERLQLSGSGMEFASEMVIKAALRGERITERPATLAPDLRDRPPHLRPWRDGWRHLRYLFMLSPWWSLGGPALVFAPAALAILAVAGWNMLFRPDVVSVFGDYWVILAATLLSISHMAAILGLASHLYGVRQGYRRPRVWSYRLARWLSLESMLLSGFGAMAAGFAVLIGVVVAWSARDYGPAESVLPAVVGALLLTLGVQNTLGGFLLAVIAGNEARFFDAALPREVEAAAEPAAEPAPAQA